MAADLDPAAIRGRTFSTSRRGFERSEVEAFLDEVAGRVGQLEDQLRTLDERMNQLGITDLPALKEEFDTVGEDVRDILQAARDAAEDMRQRAATDAAQWRSEAESEAAIRRAESQQQAEEMRADAWETSSALLEQVKAAAAEMEARANEEVLFVRAEAEREALRLTGDAKRDAEELMRASQLESEKLLESARAEAESMISAAQQSADLAQERVRALEERREELMGELEAARQRLGDLEDTIEGRRGELTHATTDPSESSVRVITPEAPDEDSGEQTISDWLDDDATVRLLPTPLGVPLEPVDADELVAEVESLRSAPRVAEPEPAVAVSGSSAESASLDFEITSGEVPAAADSAATAELVAAEPDEPPATADEGPPGSVAAEPPTEPATEPPSEAAGPPSSEPDEPEVSPEAAAEPETTEPETRETQLVPAGGIDDLFAALRQTTQQTPAEGAFSVEEETAPLAEVSPAGLEEAPVSAAEITAEQEPQEAEAARTPLADIGEPWDLRDRLLISVTNDVLRGIKRQIVDVQNAVLEELRTEPDDWRPKKAIFDTVLGPDAAAMAAHCYRAGVAASAELAGRPAPDLPDESTHSLTGLVSDLWTAVVEAIDAAADGTSRERGASVGRVFRAWRTDEAERRVRQVAHAEYNRGVAAGLDALGVAYGIQPPGRDLADPDATVIPAA